MEEKMFIYIRIKVRVTPIPHSNSYVMVLLLFYRGFEYQAEVALLSRNIVLEGTDGAERISKGPGVRISGEVKSTFREPWMGTMPKMGV